MVHEPAGQMVAKLEAHVGFALAIRDRRVRHQVDVADTIKPVGFQFLVDSHYRFSGGYEFQFNEDPTRKPEQFKIGFSILDLALFAAPFQGSIARMDFASDLTIAPRTVQAMDIEQPIYRVLANKLPALTRASMRADRSAAGC